MMSAPSASASGAAGSVNSVPTPAASAVTTQQMVGNVPALVTDTGSIADDHHTMRVVSALTDLTGKLELAWVADAGTPVGDAHCTQNIQVSPDSPARVRPTLVICWRTSPQKSVYTMAVDLDHTPSSAASVALLDQTWNALG